MVTQQVSQSRSSGVSGPAASLDGPHRVVHHPDDHPVAGAVLVEPGGVDDGVEPLPHRRRAGRRSRRSRPSGSTAAARPRSARHLPSAWGRSPATARGRRPGRSRSAGRRGSSLASVAGSATKSRPSDASLLDHPTRDRGAGRQLHPGRRSICSMYDDSVRSCGRRRHVQPRRRTAPTISHASIGIDVCEVCAACSRSSSMRRSDCGSARYISTAPLPCQGCSARCSCSCSSCGQENRARRRTPSSVAHRQHECSRSHASRAPSRLQLPLVEHLVDQPRQRVDEPTHCRSRREPRPSRHPVASTTAYFLAFSAGSEVLRAAMKASCGTSTRPTIFIRFLPSFCFSSSLRLRVMSPP